MEDNILRREHLCTSRDHTKTEVKIHILKVNRPKDGRSSIATVIREYTRARRREVPLDRRPNTPFLDRMPNSMA